MQDCDDAPRLRRWNVLLFLGLVLAGLAGNYFNYELFFDIQFLFGSIFALLALQFLGLRWGILAALIISGMTFKLWNHPYAMLVMTGEVVAVGLLQRRYKSGLVLADAFYWLFLGMPLVLLFHYWRMQLPLDNATVIMFKQAINGIFNAMLARLFFMLLARYLRQKEKFTYADILFNVLTFFVLVPALGFLTLNSRQDLAETESAIQEAFAIARPRVGGEIESWLLMKRARIENLVAEAERRPIAEMQKLLDQERRMDPDFLRLGLMDRNGVSVAYAPEVDELGQNNIGRDFGDRPYLPILKENLKAMFTEVMPGRVGRSQPIVGIVAPYAVNGVFAGYLGAVFDLQRLKGILTRSVQSQTLPDLVFLLLDRNAKVIVSSRDDLRTKDEIARAGGSLEQLPGDVTLHLPKARKNVSISERWQHGTYFEEIPLGGAAEWQLILEQPSALYQSRLYRKYATGLARIFVLLLTALGLAYILSRILTGSLARVAAISSNLPERVASGNSIVWPVSRISETDGLIDNFRVMSLSLARQFAELRGLNEDLESKTAARTREIRKSEELYRNLVKNIEARHFIFVQERAGNFAYLSPSVETLLGYPPAEFADKFGRMFTGAPPGLEIGSVELADWGREKPPCTLKITHQDGAARWLEVIKSPIRDEAGEVVAVQGIATDITSRRQAERDLRKRERQLRESQQVARLGSWELDLVTSELEWSEETYRLFDRERENFVPSQDEFARLVHPDDRQTMEDCFNQALQGNADPYHVIVRIHNDSGREWVMEVRGQVRRDEAGRPLTIFGTAQDISESVRAAEAVRRSEEFLRVIHDTVDEGFIVVDRDYRILSANRAFCQQTGETEGKVLGRHCYEVSHRSENACHELGEDCAVREVFASGEPRVARHQHEDADGNLIYVEIRAFPLKDRSGRVTAAIEVVHNITERHLLEAEQLKAQKLEAIGTLAGGIAHDFNNLLQGVFGFVSMAKLSARDPDKVNEMLGQAEEALSLSVNLTTQLLTFAKGGKPVVKTVNLRPVVENASRFALSGSRCDCRLALSVDLWPIEADEGQIAQVVQNIVLNASEAMPEGGSVQISAGNLERPGEGKLVRIDIRDNGIGIPESYLAKIFDPYFTTKQKGSGLGLATSYSIVRNHGGMIEVASEPGQGTVFSIFLPACPAKAAEDAAVSAPAPELTSPRRILVMDDEEMVRRLAVRMITASGHEAEVAAHGEEALAKYGAALASGRPFDLVILDLTVKGGMGGQETMNKLLALDPKVKAIVSSGYSDDPVVAEYRAHGFSGILNKPYSIGALRDCLHAHLARGAVEAFPVN